MYTWSRYFRKSYLKQLSDEWNSGLKEIPTTKTFTIKVPRRLEALMRYLVEEFNHVEVGVFVRANINLNDRIINIEDDFYIPEQDVTHGSIEFKEPPPEGFNGVIHSHPAGCKAFSTTDEKYINNNFDVSLLFVDGTFHDSCVRLIKDDLLIKFRDNTIEVIDDFSFDGMIPKDKIHRKYDYYAYRSKYESYRNPSHFLSIHDDYDF